MIKAWTVVLIVDVPNTYIGSLSDLKATQMNSSNTKQPEIFAVQLTHVQ